MPEHFRCAENDAVRYIAERSDAPEPAGSFWRVQARTEFQTGHGITALAFSPDGRQIVTGCRSGDNKIKFWVALTYSEVLTLHAGRSIVFSQDSRSLMTEPTVWVLASGQQLRGFGVRPGVWRAALSPDGRTIASGGEMNEMNEMIETVRLWDVASGEELRTMAGPRDTKMVTCLAFSQDDRLLASGSGTVRRGEGGVLVPSGNGTVRLWDVASGQALRTIEGNGHFVVFSPDSRQVAVPSGIGETLSYSLVGGEEAMQLKGHRAGRFLNCLKFSSDRLRIAGVSFAHKTINFWEAGTGEQICGITCPILEPRKVGPQRVPTGAVFSPDLSRILFCQGESVILLDALGGREVLTLAGSTSDVLSGGWLDGAFSPDGRWIAASTETSTTLWDCGSPQLEWFQMVAVAGEDTPSIRGWIIPHAVDGIVSCFSRKWNFRPCGLA